MTETDLKQQFSQMLEKFAKSLVQPEKSKAGKKKSKSKTVSNKDDAESKNPRIAGSVESGSPSSPPSTVWPRQRRFG